MKLHFVETMDDVLRVALERPLPEIAEAPAGEALPVSPLATEGPVTHQ
jgi:hypothetical protein